MISSCARWIDRENTKSGIYAGVRKHSYKFLQPAEHQTHQLPLLDQELDAKQFNANTFYQTAPAYLYNLKDCYLYKQMGLVLNKHHALFKEFTHHFGISTLSKFLFKRPFFTYSARVNHKAGIGAVLVSPQSHNYYHWLFDVLPRIKLYQSVAGQINHFCVSAAVPQKFLEILPQFGIPTDQLLLINDTQKFHFESLFIGSLPGSEGRSPQWAIDYVRSVLIKETSTSAAKKIYFKRGDSAGRKIINEDEVIIMLRSQGFEIINPDALSIAGQIAIVQQATVIIGAHGAALANLMFAKTGTAVIEIFSPDYFRTDCYFTLARMLALNYQYLQGTKPDHAAWGDIWVDEALLTRKLQQISA
ncbi:glycosyltransferase family 61 protein [Mucilaginibacter phyllosphaerae]|nr:glycosyltransferase family 61 protein [Mucilaginibacter phyllosphaerae]MBB3968553.1 hypothetical protein [Mucilaginibacter phyllosphaerae]GGH15281.1 hypothetical protein GCM10007352_23960 [Mucilaginibacter phyllosphaerae]